MYATYWQGLTTSAQPVVSLLFWAAGAAMPCLGVQTNRNTSRLAIMGPSIAFDGCAVHADACAICATLCPFMPG